MNVLITGATGFVGRHLIEFLKNERRKKGGPRYRIFGTCFPEHPDRCADLCAEAPFVKLVHLDLRDTQAAESVIREIKPDWVFHLAAISQVRVSWDKRRETFDANLLGTFNAFEALRRHAPKARVLFVSSSDVYGYLKPRKKAYREEDRGGIVSPYAFTKAGGELLSEFYAASEKLPIVVARPFPHTGPGQTADFVCSDWARQIALIERRPKHPSVITVGNLDIRRDYLDVRDVVRAYVLLLKKGRAGEVYNVCSGRAPALRDILNTLISLSTAKVRVKVDPAKIRKSDIPYLAGNGAKLRSRTNWAPRLPLERTLEDLLNGWRSRLEADSDAGGNPPNPPFTKGGTVPNPPLEKRGITISPVSRTRREGKVLGSKSEEGTILVTGGAGYIGSLLVGELLRRGHRVIVLDSLLFGGGSLLAHLDHPRFSFHRADVCDREAIAPFFKGVDGVVHLAAIVGYPACAKIGPEASFACNLDGTRHVFDLAEAAGARRFVFSSTYSNYGIAPDGRPVTEDSPLYPQSVYAETKIAAEKYLIERSEPSGCVPVILRFATLFGPSPRTRFDLIINQFVWEGFSEGKIVVYQRHFNRSFVHVRDIVRAILAALAAPAAKIRGRVFNVGSNAANYTKEAIVRLIQKYAPDVAVEYKDLSFDGDMRDMAVSFDRIERELGWRAEIPVEEGIRELIDAVRSGLLAKTANGVVLPVNASGD